jgi:hypothetical protein
MHFSGEQQPTRAQSELSNHSERVEPRGAVRMKCLHTKRFLATFLSVSFFISILALFGCQGLGGGSSSVGPPGISPSPTPTPDSGTGAFSGVLTWKGGSSRNGLYANETTLTPANVNTSQFGKKGVFHADGLVIAQPLLVSNVDMGAAGKHNVLIVASEHDSIFAFDADNPGAAALWQRSYLDAANGVTPMPDNFGGRTALGGEIGITGTPVIDPNTGAIYFVTALSRNGKAESWLRAVDIKTGKDFGPGSVQITASVPGDGKASVNGQIAFDPSIQNQRPGLALLNGNVLIAFGSFSDFGIYHGWLMAYDATLLKQVAVFNPTPQAQPNDVAGGPADHGGGGSFWGGGAAPAIDSDGSIFVVGADGSNNADTGGHNYGDSVLKLQLTGNAFQVVDWFSPANRDCIDEADLEIGSGGVALLPAEVGNGKNVAAVISKEGRFFILDRASLGHFNAAGDTQIPATFMVGNNTCFFGMGSGFAEGPNWQRLYGNVSYWNGNFYVGAANAPLKQYTFSNGLPNSTPFAQSATSSSLRGMNTVVSANGNSNGVVWAYEKSANGGQAILHAYDATNIGHELWNSNMSGARDALPVGTAFGVPLVVNGKVIAAGDSTVSIFGQL